jgi:WD40 repeat protein
MVAIMALCTQLQFARFLSYRNMWRSDVAVGVVVVKCLASQCSTNTQATSTIDDSRSGLPRLKIPALTPSCQLLTASGDGSVGVWTVSEETWELTFHSRLQGHSGSIYALEVVGPDLYSGVLVLVFSRDSARSTFKFILM